MSKARTKERAALYYLANRDRIKANSRAYRLANYEKVQETKAAYRIKNKVRTLLESAYSRSRARGLPFDLTADWVTGELVRCGDECKYTGVEFRTISSGEVAARGYKRQDPAAMSIDRIDPHKGYTQDNCQIISWQANKMKSELSEEMFEEVVLVMAHNIRLARGALD